MATKKQPAETETKDAPGTGAETKDTPKLGAEMSPTEAARLVKVASKDVFAFRDRGDRVVVVTVDGRKLEARK